MMTRTIGPGPDPNQIYPLHPYNKLVFLKNFIKASNIHIGDYTYFDDKRHGPKHFEEYNVLAIPAIN
jgi:virginiamycin A acetyltransferase